MGWLFIWCMFGVASAMVASQKGGSGCLWFGLGVLFGPFGLLFAFLDNGTQKQCRFCRKWIDEQASKCPFCQTELRQQAQKTPNSFFGD